jgi:putative ABC transport system permease protein
VLTTEVTAGSLRDLTGDAVAVPRDEAEDLGFTVGDRIRLRLGDGAVVEAAVVALLDGSSSYPSLVLPVDLLAAHTTQGLASQVLVRAGPGQDVSGALRDRVKDWPGVEVGGPDLLPATFAASVDMEGWINYLLAVLAIAYAAIASVNTLAVAVLARRAEFGVQRLTGATRAQVRRMLLIEGGIVALAGLVLGTVISVFSVWPIAISAGSIIPSGPVWFFFAMVAAVCLIVWPATLLAARLAMRRKPFEAIGMPGQ